MLHLVGGTNEVQHKPQMLPTYHSMQSSCGMQNDKHHEFVLLSHTNTAKQQRCTGDLENGAKVQHIQRLCEASNLRNMHVHGDDLDFPFK
jgi:hypothetical protein